MAKTIPLADVVPSRFVHLTPPSEENITRIAADLVANKVMLNEPHVFKEGDKWELLAGHDRIEAAGWTEVQVRDFTGALNTDDAVLAHFCRENLLRKEVSKAAIAGEWLRKHPEWSDGKVAEQSGCSQQYVSEVRASLVASGDIQVPVSREGRDGRTTRPRTVRTGFPNTRRTPAPPRAAPKPGSRLDAMRAQREAEVEARAAAAKAERTEERAPEQTGPDAGGSTGTTPASPAALGVGETLTGATASSVVLDVLAMIPDLLPSNPTKADLMVLSDEDEARLIALGRWSQQMVAARRRVWVADLEAWAAERGITPNHGEQSKNVPSHDSEHAGGQG